MGAGHQFEIEAMRQKRKMIHPAWSAIGCFLVAGLTTAGYQLGGWFITADAKAGWFPLPPEWAWPPQNPYLVVKIAFAILVLLLGSTLISIVYVIIHPEKPGKYDVIDPSIFPPPPRRTR
jgi:heme/copper-type cytochrome/quinol oxidase subunit 1